VSDERICRLCAEPIAVEEDAYVYQVRKVLTSGEQQPVEHCTDDWEHVVCVERGVAGQRLRITSRGDFATTTAKIIDADGRETPISDVIESMTWTVRSGQLDRAVVTFDRVEVDLQGETDGSDELAPY
jgi:hypothetical protein